MDKTNLLYNGDFSKGTDTWSGNITVENGVATMTGDIVSSEMMQFANGRRYCISFDIKFNTVAENKAFYICLIPYDNNMTMIPAARVYVRANSATTLASAINPGDTTVSLTSATGWTTGYVGICDKLAWGYNRASNILQFTSISGTTVTLKSAYNGDVVPAETKVINTYANNTYFYPWYLTAGNTKPTEWTHFSVEFNGGNNIRYSCQYAIFSTLGYTHNYSMKNIRIECISDYQEYDEVINNRGINAQFIKNGIVLSPMYDAHVFPIRYIRDTTGGNSQNINSHLNEIKVFNDSGENIAWGKDIIRDNVVYTNSVATDGVVNSQWIGSNSAVRTFYLDLGFVEKISKIQIWHYYPDNRTYVDNIVEVSADNEHWYKVYEGQKPETSAGNTILLNSPVLSVESSGRIYANDFIEW